MFSLAKWHKNYQSPCVLMIDDLSDAYIKVYEETHKNDWGYFTNQENSAYNFLKKNLLKKFPAIKITFFVPYARHNVINENTPHAYEKYAVGERQPFSDFLQHLIQEGHEIAHHGSNHGAYRDKNNLATVKNFQHEWERFETIEEGVTVTTEGIKRFKEASNIDISGGKFCGYIKRENSLEIINQCNFLYWCDEVNFVHKNYASHTFGSNHVISFPTNYAGNSFIRLSYKTGDKKRDQKKKFLKYFQPLYNLFVYQQLHKLYKEGEIISIQEHISPSTTSGNIQSANIVSDIQSLNKLYNYLDKKSIWYANCEEIAQYYYTLQNSQFIHKNNQLIISFNNPKKINNASISIISPKAFRLTQQEQHFSSQHNNHQHVISLPIKEGENVFELNKKVYHA